MRKPAALCVLLIIALVACPGGRDSGPTETSSGSPAGKSLSPKALQDAEAAFRNYLAQRYPTAATTFAAWLVAEGGQAKGQIPQDLLEWKFETLAPADVLAAGLARFGQTGPQRTPHSKLLLLLFDPASGQIVNETNLTDPVYGAVTFGPVSVQGWAAPAGGTLVSLTLRYGGEGEHSAPRTTLAQWEGGQAKVLIRTELGAPKLSWPEAGTLALTGEEFYLQDTVRIPVRWSRREERWSRRVLLDEEGRAKAQQALAAYEASGQSGDPALERLRQMVGR